MEKKSISDIIQDWKVFVLPPQGYPRYKEREGYLLVLFNELRKEGYRRSDMNSFVKSKIEDRLFFSGTKNKKKNEIKKSIEDQINSCISLVFGEFEIKEEKIEFNKVSIPQININEIIQDAHKEDDIKKEAASKRKERREAVISERKLDLIKNRFKIRFGEDGDLE